MASASADEDEIRIDMLKTIIDAADPDDPKPADPKDGESKDDDKKLDAEAIIAERKTYTTRGLSGIYNIGNTCYMNSVLQVWSNTSAFRIFLTEGGYLPHLEAKLQSDNPDAGDDEIENLVKKSITYRLSELYTEMWTRNCRVRPINLKGRIEHRKSLFCGSEQQDSEELMTLTLDAISEELGREVKIVDEVSDGVIEFIAARDKCISILNDDSLDTDVKLAAKEEYFNYRDLHDEDIADLEYYLSWKRHFRKSFSITTELFTGMFCSRLMCPECNRHSYAFDPFTLLQISIPIPESGNCGPDMELKECIKNFSSEETLSESDRWKCKSCKEKVLAKKTMHIWSLPPVLVIHLKRLVYVPVKVHGKPMDMTKKVKLETKINFSLDDLDMTEFCHEYRKKKNYKYELYAVTNHSGGSYGGHYYSYCKNDMNNMWYKYDDETVHHIPDDRIADELITGKAYMLFYKRIYPHA
jgi:ubiquitin C-terminal hydrolase